MYITAVSHEEIRKMGLYPNGANLAVSDDGGKTFRQTHEMFHRAENPSVYTKPDGTLLMCIGDECELRLDTVRREAQVGPVGGKRVSPVHERTDINDPKRFENTHSGTRDFAIANVDCIGKKYRIRISIRKQLRPLTKKGRSSFYLHPHLNFYLIPVYFFA